MRQLLINTLFILVLSASLTQAQTDTLAVRLAKVKEPVARVNELIELGRSLRAKVPQKSDSLLLMAVKESSVLKDKTIYSNALSTLGNSLNERGEVDSAAVLFRSAEAVSTKGDDPRGVAIALTGMGNNRIYRGDMPGAMDYFLRAIRVAEQTGDSSYVAASLSNIGWTYYNNDQLSEAEKFTLRALGIYNALRDSTGMAQSYNNLGIFMAEKGEFDSSLVFMQRSLDLRIRLNILKDIPWNHSNLGGLLILMGRPADGLVHLAKAAEAFERIGQMRGAVSALNNLAAANNEMGRHDECIRISLQAEKKARALQMRDLVRDAYENITSAHYNKKEYRTAFEMQERFMALKDSLVNEKSTQRMAELQALYETEKKQHEIDRLSTEAELKELRIGRQRTQIGVLGIGLLATLLLSGVGYFWYRQRQRTRLNAIMIEQQELRLKAIIEAQEDERKRIAKDLHDGTVQTLTGLKMRWERLGTQLPLTGSTADDFNRSLTILTEAGNEVRAISHQMMPRSLWYSPIVGQLKRVCY